MIEYTRPDCVFCQIIANDEQAHDLDYTVVINPPDPVADGHVLIVPRLHVVDALDDHMVTAQTMCEAVEYVKFELPYSLDAVNFITSVGEHATQTVYHLHIHVVPRRLDDGLALPWTGQVTS